MRELTGKELDGVCGGLLDWTSVPPMSPHN